MKVYYELINNLVYVRQTDDGSAPYKEGLLYGEIEWPYYNQYGIPLFKQINNDIIPRTNEELENDIAQIQPTEKEKFKAEIDYLTMENEFLENKLEQAKADIDYLLMLQGE